MFDVIIVGGGPAGMTAALYSGRAGLSCLVLEKMFFGGQMLKTYEIDNFPGVPNVQDTFAFSETLREQAASFGAEFRMEEVTGAEEKDGALSVKTTEGEYLAKTLILATGAKPKKLGVPGEEEYSGRGVSYCATCDGAFFRGKSVAVVGGGDTALEDAIYLSAMCETVYLIHRRDTFRASKILVERAEKTPNIRFVLNSNVTEVIGNGTFVTEVCLERGDNLLVSGVFFAVGTVPESEWLNHFVETDENGAVITDERFMTNIPGVFVAGDLRKKALRQVITACADGAECAHQALRYLMESN